jgi:hypothetical protein
MWGKYTEGHKSRHIKTEKHLSYEQSPTITETESSKKEND